MDIQPIIWDLGLSENGGILPQIMAIWILPLGKMSINRWILRAPYFRQTLWIGAHDLNELPVHLSCGAEHDPSRRSNHRNFPWKHPEIWSLKTMGSPGIPWDPLGPWEALPSCNAGFDCGRSAPRICCRRLREAAWGRVMFVGLRQLTINISHLTLEYSRYIMMCHDRSFINMQKP